jgi:hypothetical protein
MGLYIQSKVSATPPVMTASDGPRTLAKWMAERVRASREDREQEVRRRRAAVIAEFDAAGTEATFCTRTESPYLLAKTCSVESAGISCERPRFIGSREPPRGRCSIQPTPGALQATFWQRSRFRKSYLPSFADNDRGKIRQRIKVNKLRLRAVE